MKTLKFIEGTLPAALKQEADSYLFDSAEHRKLQSPKGWTSFHLIDSIKKKVYASLHLHIDGALAESPHKAPFGGVVFSEKVRPEELYKFISDAEAALRKKGIQRIVLRNPPEAYHPYTGVIISIVLMNLGYSVVRAEINTSIAITEKLFDENIDSWEHRKLKQARKEKLKCRQLPLDSLPEVYTFISVCREERGQALSMGMDELRKTSAALPRSFFLFAVFNDEEMVAASIAIRVSRKILYNFYSAHPKQFDKLSPVVLLTESLYEWCQQQEMSLLDLGTSALGDVPNFGLLDFKLRLGGTPSARITYGKNIA